MENTIMKPYLRGCSRFAISLVVIVAVVKVAAISAAPPSEMILLQKLDPEAAELTDGQRRALQSLKKEPSSAHVSVATIRTDVLKAGQGDFWLSDSKELKIALKNTAVDRSGRSTELTWKCEDKGESGAITIRGKSAVGLVYTGEKVFEVKPIGGGIHAIVELDQSRFPRDQVVPSVKP